MNKNKKNVFKKYFKKYFKNSKYKSPELLVGNNYLIVLEC